jgi:hypothetical protein
MNHSHLITEFTITKPDKSTPSTGSPTPFLSTPCHFCRDHLSKVTELRKREILLELDNEKLKEENNHLKREREELINSKILSYE